MDEGKKSVLMIDDETDIVSFFSKTFQNFPQIEFKSTNNPVEGISIAKELKPNVILIDLRMPGMNGEDAIQEMKTFLPEETRYVVMTGWQDSEIRRKLEEEVGVAAYFEKPVDLEKVITKVMSLIMLKE